MTDDSKASAPADTVTVSRYGRQRFKVAFSRLPGQVFGPWDLAETIRGLTVSALMKPIDARNLVLDAAANGRATARVGSGGR